jgi:hypothetical protein
MLFSRDGEDESAGRFEVPGMTGEAKASGTNVLEFLLL